MLGEWQGSAGGAVMHCVIASPLMPLEPAMALAWSQIPFWLGYQIYVCSHISTCRVDFHPFPAMDWAFQLLQRNPSREVLYSMPSGIAWNWLLKYRSKETIIEPSLFLREGEKKNFLPTSAVPLELKGKGSFHWE